jgi:hypothetical protein
VVYGRSEGRIVGLGVGAELMGEPKQKEGGGGRERGKGRLYACVMVWSDA